MRHTCSHLYAPHLSADAQKQQCHKEELFKGHQNSQQRTYQVPLNPKKRFWNTSLAAELSHKGFLSTHSHRLLCRLHSTAAGHLRLQVGKQGTASQWETWAVTLSGSAHETRLTIHQRQTCLNYPAAGDFWGRLLRGMNYIIILLSDTAFI